jgi:hypothetical protein
MTVSRLISKHLDAFVPPWHNFKNSVMVEIELLLSKPFMNRHCYFLISVELVTSPVSVQWHKQVVCCMLPLQVIPHPKNKMLD